MAIYVNTSKKGVEHRFWYPDDGDQYKYVYRETLEFGKKYERIPDAYTSGMSALTKARNEVDSSTHRFNKNGYLSDLIDKERKAELDFLTNRLGVKVTDTESLTEIVKLFNEVFNLTAVFERNIRKVQELANMESRNGRIDVSLSFQNYLQKSLQYHLEKENLFVQICTIQDPQQVSTILKPVIDKALEDALIEMYSSGDKGKNDSMKSYLEIANAMRAFFGSKQHGPFIQEILNIYNYNEIQELAQQISEGLYKDSKFSNGKVTSLSRGRSKLGGETLKHKLVKGVEVKDWWLKDGNLAEVVSNYVLNEFSKAKIEGIDFERVGGSNYNLQKADIRGMSIKTTYEIPDLKDFEAKGINKRIQNMNRWYEYLKSLQGVEGDMVLINQKNYTLNTSKFIGGGFQAEAPTVENLGRTLNHIGYDATDALIYLLSNCGEEVIGNGSNLEELKKTIARSIGAWLFDDIEFKEDIPQSGPNRIHILLLDNIYIPFSVFLEQLNKALGDVENYEDYVTVSVGSIDSARKKYVPASIDWDEYRQAGNFVRYYDTKPIILKPKHWNKYAADVHKAQVRIGFLRNFANFVRDLEFDKNRNL